MNYGESRYVAPRGVAAIFSGLEGVKEAIWNVLEQRPSRCMAGREVTKIWREDGPRFAFTRSQELSNRLGTYLQVLTSKCGAELAWIAEIHINSVGTEGIAFVRQDQVQHINLSKQRGKVSVVLLRYLCGQ
ncbi:hypothetical protein PMIN07_001095 [Paraphaeosphaeria minitans]